MFSAARERVKRYVSDGRATSWTAREISTTVHVLVLLLTLNAFAIYLRNRYRRTW